VTLTLPPAES
uniref:Cryptide Pep-17 n=1 Tax=Tityus obscurus TaxID=1221240 RepID=CRY17_TITOB